MSVTEKVDFMTSVHQTNQRKTNKYIKEYTQVNTTQQSARADKTKQTIQNTGSCCSLRNV